MTPRLVPTRLMILVSRSAIRREPRSLVRPLAGTAPLVLALLVLAALLVLSSSSGADPRPREQATRLLVLQLGHDSFAAREEAAEQLAQLGLSAKDALQLGREHDDAEIRSRSRRIWELVQQRDFQHRLQSFLHDEEDGRGFPGWKRFRDAIGSGAESRTLFAEMLKAESHLLEI
ncbi:MAG: hypothetical protein N2C14_17540, partial [Planctomycetales bacterium]